MSAMKIAIVGAGANGAGIGADLIRAGLDVTLIDQWPQNVETLRTVGVTVESPDGESVTTPARAWHLCELAEQRPQFDLVFVVVKAYDTEWTVRLIEPYLAEDGIVVGLQNGMMAERIADIVGPHRTLGAVIEIAAAMWTPGVVERQTPPSGTWFGLGALDRAASGREADVAEVLKHAGTVAVVDDILSAKWMKLVVNAAELVPSAILDLPLLDAARVPGMHDFMVRTGKEAIHACVASQRSVVPIFGLDVPPSGDPDEFVDDMLAAVYTNWSLPSTKTTVLQDWQKGRRSEVIELNGFVVDAARRAGLPALLNGRTVEIAMRIERRELTPHPNNARLLLS